MFGDDDTLPQKQPPAPGDADGNASEDEHP
jgi:hypothetical protein